MNSEQIASLARRALADIASKPKGHVYASRKGIVAATNDHKVFKFHTVAFRRSGESIGIEVWKNDNRSKPPDKYPLPALLQRRAAELLDSL